MNTHSLENPTPVVVVGSLNMDLVMRLARVPEAGETITGQEFAVIAGGKGANQAVACARLGCAVAMIGQTGDDGFGKQLRETLQRDRIDLTHVGVDANNSTGVAMIMVDAAAQNRIALVAGANGTLTPAHIDAAARLIDSAALLIVQLEVPLATIEYAIERAVRAGRPVLLNPAPAQALPDTLWRNIDYLVPNESEAALLTGIAVQDIASAERAANILRERGVRQVLITLGAQGVVIADAAGARHYPAQKVKAVDTTAAGDTFIGGFAAGLVEGMNVDQAAQLGLAAAAICVTRPGAQPAIPYRRELPQNI